jgi:hypothetical protein
MRTAHAGMRVSLISNAWLLAYMDVAVDGPGLSGRAFEIPNPSRP